MEKFIGYRRITAQPVVHRTELMRNFQSVKLDDLRRASYEDMRRYGVDEMVENGLGLLLDETSAHGLFFYTKNAVNTDYDMLLNCFPKSGHPINHGLDEIPENTREMLFNGVESAIDSIVELAAANNDPLSKLFALQHIGPGEADHMNGYHTTYAQTHWHTYAVPVSYYQSCKVEPAVLAARSFTHAFWDPTIVIAYDLLKPFLPSVSLERPTSSLVIRQSNLDLRIPDSDRQLLPQLMEVWKDAWHQIAECFTDFSQDEHQRYLPLEPAVRQANVARFIENHPELSDDSQYVLRRIASNLRRARSATENRFHLFFKNINGSLGYTHDFENQTTTLRVAPRSFVTPDKVGATDGTFYTIKNRESEIDELKKNSLFKLQRCLLKSAQNHYQSRSGQKIDHKSA